MKKLFTLPALTLCFFAALAQQPDTAQIMVHYKFSHVRDTACRANPYTENMVLFVGKKAGVYRSYDRHVEAQLFRRQVQAQIANSPDGHIRMNIRIREPSPEYFQFPDENRLVKAEDFFGVYIINEPLPVIRWKIRSDTASFGELHCQKATCHFRGRDYVAWFCPDLPVHAGPWKLNGLPGVIVDAYDVKKEVVFKFDGVEKVPRSFSPGRVDRQAVLPGMFNLTDDPTLIQVPPKGTKTTEHDLEHLQEIARKDPGAFTNMLKGTPYYDQPKPIQIPQKPIINNPIELPEKQ